MTLTDKKRLVLEAETAAELMMPNPVSIRDTVVVREAVAFLTDKGISAAPVIDEAGRPVGVLSRADIVVHDREQTHHVHPDLFEGEAAKVPAGYQVEDVDRTPVRDIMTPVVFSVAPDAPAATVVHEMLSLKVHRLFVVDAGEVLVGVISAFDVLRHLKSNDKTDPRGQR